jgi:hypothetical protein
VFFERVVWSTMAAGMVKGEGEGFAVDASVLEANASRYHGKPPAELDWTDAQRQKRAVAEYLAAIDAEAQSAEAADRSSDTDNDPHTPRQRRAERKAPKVISPSDPSSAWTAKANKRAHFGYGLNYLIDVEHAVIVDVEATSARTYDEVATTWMMIDRTARCFDLKPKRLIADTAYGTGKFLGWLVKEKHITPHIPVWDKSTREDGTFSRADFKWDGRANVYICPNKKVLRTTGRVHEGMTLRFHASKYDCTACPLKARCCPNMPARQIPRDIHEDARDVARRQMTTNAFLRSRNERKRVEMRFAHLKTHHGFERLRLRGLAGARDEFHLAATVQNLKTLALRLLKPPEPAPAWVACVEFLWRQRQRRPEPARRTTRSINDLQSKFSTEIQSAPSSDFFDSIGQTRQMATHMRDPSDCIPAGHQLIPSTYRRQSIVRTGHSSQSDSY